MQLELSKKVVLVSGGTRGIGGGISVELAREGAHVVILSRRAPESEFLSKMNGLSFEFHEIELSQTEKIESLMQEITAKHPKIFAVVNNAGVNDNLAIESTSYQDFEASLRKNLLHYYELTRCALPFIEEEGSVLNIASKVALTGQGKTSAYAAAKGAILGLTREWSVAFLKRRIRVNAIVVAECFTPLYENWIKSFGDEKAQKEQLEKITRNIPLERRMSSIEEIANTAVFLLSKRASHTTGQWVYVDGGYCHLDRAL